MSVMDLYIWNEYKALFILIFIIIIIVIISLVICFFNMCERIKIITRLMEEQNENIEALVKLGIINNDRQN